MTRARITREWLDANEPWGEVCPICRGTGFDKSWHEIEEEFEVIAAAAVHTEEEFQAELDWLLDIDWLTEEYCPIDRCQACGGAGWLDLEDAIGLHLSADKFESDLLAGFSRLSDAVDLAVRTVEFLAGNLYNSKIIDTVDGVEWSADAIVQELHLEEFVR